MPADPQNLNASERVEPEIDSPAFGDIDPPRELVSSDELESISKPVGRSPDELDFEAPLLRNRVLECPVESPAALRKISDRLAWRRKEVTRGLKQTDRELKIIEDYLGISDQVTQALDSLSQKLFEEVLGVLEDKLSIALQEVLEQPIEFKASASFKRGAASVDFSIQRDGNTEDVNRGQGGSVQNVLSVGLRLFALARLDPQEHRRFLVLDEQDCWLRPELVPRLVNIVHRAAKQLGFQVILISHHDVGLFEKYADKIYRFTPQDGSVKVEQVGRGPVESD